MKKFLKYSVLAIVLIYSYTVSASDKSVAIVNGVALTEVDLQKIINELLPITFYHRTVTPEKRAELRKKALEELIKRELYYQEGKKTGIRINRTEINEGLETIKKRFKSKKEYKEALRQAGISEDDLKRDIERNLVIQKFYQKEVIEKSKISDEYLKDYYEKNKKDFLRPESAHIRHILIKIEPTANATEKEEKKKLALEVLEKARQGEDFGALAFNYSDDDWRVKGGDLGLIHRGRLLPELEEVAFKLRPGEISDLIETIYGFHIIKLEEKMPPVQLSFDEIREKLKKEMEEKRRKEIEESLIKSLKDKSKVEILE